MFLSLIQISMVPVKSGESKEKESVKLRVLEPWLTAESMGTEGTVLGTGLGLGVRSALKLPSFKVPPIKHFCLN